MNVNDSWFVLTSYLLLALAVGLTILVTVPAIARARLLGELSQIHDEIEDLVIAGELANVEAVKRTLSRLDAAMATPRIASYSYLKAMHDAGLLKPVAGREISFADLEPEQRKAMHDFDRRTVDAMVRCMTHGSVTWPLWMCLRPLVRTIARRAAQPTPTNLSWEFVRSRRDTVTPTTSHHRLVKLS